MKENNGRAARRKQARRMIWLAGGSLTVCALILWLSSSSSSSFNSNNSNNSINNNKKQLRDTPTSRARQSLLNPQVTAASEKGAKFRKDLTAQFFDHDEGELLQDVLTGKLHLIDIEVVEEDLLRAPANSYAGVYGVFCKLEWELHKKDPSAGTYQNMK
jgi:hypothetical protein